MPLSVKPPGAPILRPAGPPRMPIAAGELPMLDRVGLPTPALLAAKLSGPDAGPGSFGVLP